MMYNRKFLANLLTVTLLMGPVSNNLYAIDRVFISDLDVLNKEEKVQDYLEETEVIEGGRDKTTPAQIEIVTNPALDRLETSKILELRFNRNIQDSSTNEIQGIWHGDTEQYVSGQVDEAIRFNGSNNYIDLGTSSALQPENLTVSFWVRPESELGGDEQLITWFKPNGNWQGDGWYLTTFKDEPLKLSTGTGVQESYIVGNRSEFFPVGEWTHIAVTYDTNTKNVSIYRNGIAQEVRYTKQVGEIKANDIDHKYMGFNSPGYGGSYIKMDIDEFKVYDTVATIDEIRSIYQSEGGHLNEEQIAQLDLDEVKLPTTIISDINFPTQGTHGSMLTYTSSNTDVISHTGDVKIPNEDTEVSIHVTSAYGGAIKEKDITVIVKVITRVEKIQQFDMEDVELTDPYYVNAFEKDVDYLLSLDADRLLAGFKAVSEGKDPGNATGLNLYDGWEGSWSLLRGHTLGHYMSAISQAYKQTKTDGNIELNQKLQERIDYIINQLTIYQNQNTGYLFASTEKHFDIIEGKAQGPTWVPWYTLHKLMTGLIDVYQYEGNEAALQIASNLGTWTYERTSKWDKATQDRVLAVEYGGMNDCLYELFKFTQDPNHLTAAHMFDEISLFIPIEQGKNILVNKHANTTIPKFIGALNRYSVLGKDEEFYLRAAEQFWDLVINQHTYVTGGNSQSEHFREPDQLDSTRDNVNNESCNSYNMLRLSRELFKITGDVKYADFYEKSFINEIMSCINPETGMTTYFKPMGTGYFKVFAEPTTDFWCCTGTGMENFTKLDDSIYYHTDNDLYVNTYLSSNLNWKEKGIKLIQNADLPASNKVIFTIEEVPLEEDINIKFRSPYWIAEGEEMTVRINGDIQDISMKEGYIDVRRIWHEGDTIELTLPMEVQVSRLPDNKDAIAFTYGPVVLSAGLGTEKMERIPHWSSAKASIPDGVVIKDYMLIKEGSIDNWIDNIKDNLVKTDGKMEFTLRNTDEDENLKFTPHYLRYKDRYGIYFRMAGLDSELFQQMILDKKAESKNAVATIDDVLITNDQHELAHNLQGNSGSGYYGGYNYRDARGDKDGTGWFSYDMEVDSSQVNYLTAKYYSGDVGRTFNIYIDGMLLKEETIQSMNPTQFYNVRYQIPQELLEGKEKVTIKFANRGASFVGGVFDKISIRKDYDKNANLQSIVVDRKEVELVENTYTIAVNKNATQAIVNFTPENANALIYVNDILIDDTVDRKVDLAGEITTLNIKVVAEDEEIQQMYTLEIKKEIPDEVAVTGVSLDKSTLSLVEGASEQLTATVSPGNASNKVVKWSSSDANVVAVNEEGKVTAVGAGKAKVSVTTVDGQFIAEVTITVTQKASENSSSNRGTTTTVPINVNKGEQNAQSEISKVANTIIIFTAQGHATKDGKNISLSVRPYIENGRTMVGLRDVAQLLNVEENKILWDNTKKQITLVKDEHTIILTINKKYIIVDGKQVIIDAAPQIKNGRTVLPIMHIGKILGVGMKFDNRTKQVQFKIK